MTDAGHENVHTLPYAPSSGRRVAQLVKWLLAVTILGVPCLYLAWRWGPPYFAQWQYLRLQRSCAEWMAPARHVVYEEDPTLCKALIGKDGFKSEDPRAVEGRPPNWIAPVSWRPSIWNRLFEQTTWWGAAFMHERRASSVGKRIVVVDFVLTAVRPDGRRLLMMITHSYIPADWRPGSRVQRDSGVPAVQLDLAQTDRLRIYAGHPDPADSARFVIPYSLNGQDGFFEGALHPDGNVTLKRIGPAPAPLPPWPPEHKEF